MTPANYAAGKYTDPKYTSYTPFDFGSATGFEQKADNSVAGEMRDCGECHVGGGFMQYYTSSVNGVVDATNKPFQYDPANRTDYRDATLTTVNAFNTYIDIFGLDGLGFEPTDHAGVARDINPASTSYVGPTYTAQTNDFAQTGVLEMDCLICHMDGYSWEARRNEVRKGNFDSSRVAGAGLGEVINGRNVTYNSNVVAVTNATTGETTYKLSATAAAKISGTPKSGNCASCHQAEHQVDWKKRGEMWVEGNDVHYGFGCMACHERKPDAAVGTTGLQSELSLGQCDPAKGNKSPFDALWNKVDAKGFKTCEDCHQPSTTPTWNTYGAPNSNAAHAAAGLNATLLQAPGERNGVASKSHIDIIDCTACHARNKNGITGGAFVDGTGTDVEGRVALHDENQVAKDMNNGLALHWLGGKLYSANLLTSFFWRDMNDYNLDANNDGRPGGMDALLPAHVAKINLANGVKALSVDGITATEITERQNMLAAGLEALTGAAFPLKADGVTKNFIPRISMLTVPFKASHNISPAAAAWGTPGVDAVTGARVEGCGQCHSTAGGFYNGAYPINGNISWTFGANQLATFTKVNGKMDATEGHPNILDKHGNRTVAFQLFNPTTSTSLRNIDRSEVIYEATFKAPAAAQTTFTEGAILAGAAPAGMTNSSSDGGVSTKGHIIKIDVEKYDTANSKWVAQDSRTWSSGGEFTTIDAVITAMGAYATSADTYGFTVTNNGGKFSINPTAGFRVKLNGAMDFGPYGFGPNAFTAAPQKGVFDANNKVGAIDWVGYLNGITADKAGIGLSPVADITSSFVDVDPAVPGVQVYTTEVQALAAGEAQNGKGLVKYEWSSSDGTAIAATQSSSVTFTTAGSKTVTLKVTDEEGKQASKTVSVSAVIKPADVIAWTDNAGALSGTLTLTGLPTPNNKVKIVWGDGMYEYVTTVNATDLSKAHTYTSAGNKLVQIYIYNSGVQKGYFKKTITVDGTN
ncbi:MAG: PKD domain-containing protein [Geobacter sp.]|nr:MAG: PKD domain-containing protein [Geobacter sp.]